MVRDAVPCHIRIIMPTIKSPACYDVSHHKVIPDFSKLDPKPLFMFTKATEAAPNRGYLHTDKTLQPYLKGMTDNGIHRGVFHFNRMSVSPTEQAAHFVNTITPHITSADWLVLDLEESKETAAHIIAFFDYVQKILSNPVMIYSRKNVLELMTLSAGQRDRLKQIKIWTAAYPYLPDLYNEPPAYSIPNQNDWGPVWAWQYSAQGRVAGIYSNTEATILGNVDLNWMSTEFIASLKTLPPPEPTPTKAPIIHIITQENEDYPAYDFEMKPK